MPMSFAEALTSLHEAKRVTRAAWHGTQFLFMGGDFKGLKSPAIDDMFPEGVVVHPCLFIFMGSYALPFEPSQTDMLSQDWEIVA